MASHAQHPIDVYVGGRLRLRRIMLGISQQELGAIVGITFQQVQKYEKGTNRIGASRLYNIARALRVSVEYFFEDMLVNDKFNQAEAVGLNESLPPYDEEIDDFISASFGRNNKDVLLLIRYFQNIKDSDARKRTLSLVRGISQLYDKDGEENIEEKRTKKVRETV